MAHYGSDYPIDVQAHAVPAMAALHNFIHIHDPDEDIEPLEDSSYEPITPSNETASGSLHTGVSTVELK